MSRQPRVEVIGQGTLNPREWLRRDVLWASLMSPYSRQIAGWIDGTAVSQHMGNVSRQKLYSGIEDDVQAQSMGFFNQGKNIAGLISSVALFRACMAGGNEGGAVTIVEVQAKSIDKVLGNTATDSSTGVTVPEAAIYAECADIMKKVATEPTQFGNKQRLLKASNLMARLASNEAGLWIETSYQDEAGNLPNLTINNGGHPRSAGPRVEMLTPIFNHILESSTYLTLAE